MRTQQTLAIALTVIVLLFSSGSREWIHQFAGHKDTVHTHEDDVRKGMVFEKEHHHCDFLDITLPIYLFTENLVNYSTVLEYANIAKVDVVSYYSSELQYSKYVRGPPTV